MKTRTYVTELTFEDLVAILSPGFTDIFSVEYIERYNDLKKGDFYEDRLANILLAGGKIGIVDNYAEGDINGKGYIPTEFRDDGTVLYEVGLQDIKHGIEKALNGEPYERRILQHYFEGQYDADDAQNLMQIIVFGEEIYG